MECSSKHVFVLQHHDCEGLGIIADPLKRAGITPHYIRSFEGQPVPKELADAGGLVVLSGPQSVYDHHKFPCLRDEVTLVENALKHSRPVFGVYLGSQLLAANLGANVYPARTKEVWVNQVTLTEAFCGNPRFADIPKSPTAFHGHGDVFDLPPNATLLASSALTANQAFRHGRNVYGLLFHMEVTFPQIRAMVDIFADELQSAGSNGAAIKLNACTHLCTLQEIGRTVFSRWVALLR